MCHPCVWNNRRIAGGSGSRLGCCGWVVAGAGQAVISLAARSSLGLGHHWATTRYLHLGWAKHQDYCLASHSTETVIGPSINRQVQAAFGGLSFKVSLDNQTSNSHMSEKSIEPFFLAKMFKSKLLFGQWKLKYEYDCVHCNVQTVQCTAQQPLPTPVMARPSAEQHLATALSYHLFTVFYCTLHCIVN